MARFPRNLFAGDSRAALIVGLLGVLLLSSQLIAAPIASAQNFVLTVPVLINSQNSAGYNTNPQTPGEFQRFAERYLQHLQIPYELIDVATQTPPTLTQRQLIISGHSGLNLSATWQTAISAAVSNGVGFVNLDSSSTVGQQLHMQTIFGATGSSLGTPGTALSVPAAVLPTGAGPHYIAGLQQKFAGDPAGDIVYNFHPDSSGAVQTVTSTLLTGGSGTVLARIGSDPLIVATSFGAGRAVHFGTLNYLRADRFGFMMGADDLFWRSVVWAARKPFVVRGFPRFWAVQMDDTLAGWPARVRDMYNPALTGTQAANGTGGPWRVTGYAFTDNLAPASADRTQAIADVQAGSLQLSPHARGLSNDLGSYYWVDPNGNLLTPTTWGFTVQDIQAWINGNGGTDRIPSISRSMVPHFWNLSTLTGNDMWNTLGFRYVTEIQQPGIDFFSKTATVGRAALRPFRLYELPPMSQPNEDYPIYHADNYVVNGRTFFNFATQVINLNRYDRTDVGWPNTTRTVGQSVDQFQYYTWRLWSGLAPTQIYTHDGSNNYILSTVPQRQQVIQSVSSWLNARGVRHIFMQDLGDYMYARTQSVLTGAQATGGTLTLNLSGNAATADGALIATEFLLFTGDDEGAANSVPGFTGGSTVNVSFSIPVPATSSIAPTSALAGSAPLTLTVNGTGFVQSSVVRWNGANRTTTYISPTQLQAAIPATDVATTGSATVTVFNPAPGGGTSNPRTFTIAAGNFPVPTTTGLAPSSVVMGSAAFTLTVNGTNFVAGSIVRWNGANRTTTVVSATQASASISAADVAAQGTAQVTVFNPSPGGGTSNSQAFSITSNMLPVPTTAAITPASASVGGAAFTLTVNGTGFVSSSTVRWNGANRTTTFASATQLTAAIPAADIAAVGTAQVTVFNPAPGGGTSNAQSFSTVAANANFFDDFNRADGATIGNGWIQKSTAFSLASGRVVKAPTAIGYEDNLVYRPASESMLDGEASVELRFNSLPPGYAQVFVRAQTATIANAGIFNGYLLYTDNDSGRVLLDRVENSAFFPLATIALSPTLNTTDTFRLRLRATGTSPVALSAFVERFTTASGWQVIGQAIVNDSAATRFSTAGTVGFSGYVEGGVYSYDNFTRASFAGQISLDAINPASAIAGSAGFTLTVTGTNFASDSVVRWNGANRTTTFSSTSQLTATIPATDVTTAGSAQVTVFTASAANNTSNAQPFAIIAPGASFADDFNRPDNASIGNGWTEKFPGAFSIQSGEVVDIDTGLVDYHDAIVYRPATEDQRDVEVGLEFRILPGQTFPQVHARAQRNTLTLANTLDDYIFFVDGFEPSPGRAIIARQQPVAGQFECYMMAIPFTTPLQQSDRYRLRFQVTGANPVTLTGIVERLVGTTWQLFASGTTLHDNTTQNPGIYCDPGFMPPPITTAGAVGFGKWRTANEVYDNFYWINLTASPVPTTTSVSPTSASAGGAAFTLTVNGTNFVNGSTVRWNGANRTTTFVSATQLTAAIPASDITTAGSASVTVFNSTPGGGTSNAQTFTISPANPVPTTTSLNPTSATAGGAAFTLTVNGTNFVAGSIVRWNGANRTTTFVSATQLTAAIPATDITTTGTSPVTVFNPTPGGGTSNSQTFTIAASNPVPTTTSLNPTSATAGGAAFTLTVNGTNFVAGSIVRWNGANRTTTFVSATQLTAAIPASDITTAGTTPVTVFNPTPGGGTSNAQTFTITGGGGGTSTTVTFDSPVPPGGSGSFLNGVYQGIDFGTNQWAWETAFGPDSTNHIYFGSASGTSRTFTFSPGPRTLVSIRVFTGANGTLTLTDNLGQTRAQAITTGSMQLVTTGWTQASTTVTVTFTAGWELGVDDIVYNNP
jgi:hypothetical protein